MSFAVLSETLISSATISRDELLDIRAQLWRHTAKLCLRQFCHQFVISPVRKQIFSMPRKVRHPGCLSSVQNCSPRKSSRIDSGQVHVFRPVSPAVDLSFANNPSSVSFTPRSVHSDGEGRRVPGFRRSRHSSCSDAESGIACPAPDEDEIGGSSENTRPRFSLNDGRSEQ